ncbi:MAG: hypothetical protein EOM73_06235 [Bacteroidia bacterium]|nr:hypothetical protein [Bacteroidia bacterium]
MGFNLSGIGPIDQKILREFENEIIKVLRNSSALIKRGECKQTSFKWFGSSTEDWMKILSTNLDKMASIINTKDILVSQANLKKRDTRENAAAYRPNSGWETYTNMSKAQGQNFTIKLNSAWEQLNKYSPPNTHVQSKFQTMVHELTHLILNTDDVPPPYGETNCLNKAKTKPLDAQKNAENWGFFVENMRNPVLNTKVDPVSSKIWLEKTTRNLLHYRSGDLIILDNALIAYENGADADKRQKLKNAFNTWFKHNPQERTKRNIDRVVDRLKEYIESL